MDENDLRLLTGVSFSRATKARYVRQSADLSAETQRRLDELVLREPRAIRTIGGMNDDAVAAFLDIELHGAAPVDGVPASQALRDTIVEANQEGVLSTAEVSAFAKSTRTLEQSDMDGVAANLRDGIAKQDVGSGGNQNIRGTVYEARVGANADEFGLEGIDSLDDLDAMSFEVSPDFDSLTSSGPGFSDDVQAIADEIEFPNIPEDEQAAIVRRALDDSQGIEFDVVRNPESGDLVYIEAKAGEIDTSGIREEIIKLRAYQRLNPDIDSGTLAVVSKRGRGGQRVSQALLDLLDENDNTFFISHP